MHLIFALLAAAVGAASGYTGSYVGLKMAAKETPRWAEEDGEELALQASRHPESLRVLQRNIGLESSDFANPENGQKYLESELSDQTAVPEGRWEEAARDVVWTAGWRDTVGLWYWDDELKRPAWETADRKTARRTGLLWAVYIGVAMAVAYVSSESVAAGMGLCLAVVCLVVPASCDRRSHSVPLLWFYGGVILWLGLSVFLFGWDTSLRGMVIGLCAGLLLEILSFMYAAMGRADPVGLPDSVTLGLLAAVGFCISGSTGGAILMWALGFMATWASPLVQKAKRRNAAVVPRRDDLRIGTCVLSYAPIAIAAGSVVL